MTKETIVHYWKWLNSSIKESVELFELSSYLKIAAYLLATAVVPGVITGILVRFVSIFFVVLVIPIALFSVSYFAYLHNKNKKFFD